MATKTLKEQPQKDSKSKRINLDNERESKYDKSRGTHNGRSKSRKFKSSNSDRYDKYNSKGTRNSTDNDISWYARNPELLRAASSLPAYSVVGDRIPLDNTIAVPGVMALYWNPVATGIDTDAINQAKDSMYSYIVHANSRNQTYDASDLMVLLTAGMNVFTTIAHLIRAYGVAKQYSEVNRYMPGSLLEVMGFNPNDVINHLSQMWFDINQLISQTSQIWIPNTMPMLTRQMWMNTNIYTDAESPKAQMYMYVPDRFYIYKPTNFEDGGAVLPMMLEDFGRTGGTISISNVTNSTGTSLSGTLTWAQWKDMVQAQINALVNDQDRGIIFGDILKAFGPDRIFAMSPITVDYRTPIVYNKEVLMQIENALIGTQGYAPSGIKQDQSTEKIVQLWGADSSPMEDFGLNGRSVLNFHTMTAPSPEEIMVASRLHPGAVRSTSVKVISYNSTDNKWIAKSQTHWIPGCCGTELIQDIKFVRMTQTTNGTMVPVIIPYKQLQTSTTWDGYTVEAQNAFDWCPWVYRLTTNSTGGSAPTNITTTNATGEWDYYIVVDSNELEKMHTAAVYSEYGVPYI